MPATVTLPSFLLAEAISATESEPKIVLADAGQSTLTEIPTEISYMDPLVAVYVYCEGELMRVIRPGIGSRFVVRRGAYGTAAAQHDAGATCYVGAGHEFYDQDPTGSPREVEPVSPWINVHGGNVWFALGDAQPNGLTRRWWSKQEMKYVTNSLGVREFTLDPIVST